MSFQEDDMDTEFGGDTSDEWGLEVEAE